MMKVKVELIKDREDFIRVRVLSKKRLGAAMQKDMRYVDIEAYPGGVSKAVEDLAGFLSEAMNAHPKYKDDHDPESVARDAVKAFRKASSEVLS